MNIQKFLEVLKNSMGFSVGVLSHYYASKYLDRNEIKEEAHPKGNQEIRDKKLDKVVEGLEEIKTKIADTVESGSKLIEAQKNSTDLKGEVVERMGSVLDQAKEISNSISNSSELNSTISES